MIDASPWRATAPAAADRPVDLARLPLVRDGRPRKRWRYVGVFGERLMLCAGVAEVGPFAQAFWAVWDRERSVLRERTRIWRGRRFVRLPPARVLVHDDDAWAALVIEPGVPVETVSPHGGAWIWTRKQAGVRVHGTVVLDGEPIAIDALGCVDDSAGYHARETAWEWSAGVGALEDGRPAAWNLVSGVHDDPVASERSVWVGGVPVHVPPVRFAADLSAVGGLRFTPEATRRRREHLGLVRSDYVQPFGTFGGTLGAGLELRSGLGVMERHSALW